MKPSIGCIVHYVSHGTPGGEYTSQCRAAIVTEVTSLEGNDAAQAEIENWDGDQRCRVSLAVLNPNGLFFDARLWQDQETKRGGTWHWPETAPDPLNILTEVETAPRYTLVPGCDHCPDGHTPPDHGQPWGARVGPERDGDGQPTTIHVARSGGAHVAESDAQWIRDRLNGCR